MSTEAQATDPSAARERPSKVAREMSTTSFGLRWQKSKSQPGAYRWEMALVGVRLALQESGADACVRRGSRLRPHTRCLRDPEEAQIGGRSD
jgi:hypothetical protein